MTEQDHTEVDRAVPASERQMWCEGLLWSVLSVDYQPILQLAADRARLRQGPVTCQETAAEFGMDVVPARMEVLRSKAKHPVALGLAGAGPDHTRPRCDRARP